MTKVNEIYRCNICGNIVAMVHGGAGSLVCCGEEMRMMKENSVDAAKEKHVPIVEDKGEEIIVKVGEILHPMEEAHYIEWIELVCDGKSTRHFLKPGNKPETKFDKSCDSYTVRAYCNLHGLWKN
jgi:superoxide reductase